MLLLPTFFLLLTRFASNTRNRIGYSIIEPSPRTVWFQGEVRVIDISHRIWLESNMMELCPLWLRLVPRVPRKCRFLRRILSSSQSSLRTSNNDAEPVQDQWTIKVPDVNEGWYFVQAFDGTRPLTKSAPFRILQGIYCNKSIYKLILIISLINKEMEIDAVQINYAPPVLLNNNPAKADLVEKTKPKYQQNITVVLSKLFLLDDKRVYRLRLINSSSSKDLAAPFVLDRRFLSDYAHPSNEFATFEFEIYGGDDENFHLIQPYPSKEGHFYAQLEIQSIPQWTRSWQPVRRLNFNRATPRNPTLNSFEPTVGTDAAALSSFSDDNSVEATMPSSNSVRDYSGIFGLPPTQFKPHHAIPANSMAAAAFRGTARADYSALRPAHSAPLAAVSTRIDLDTSVDGGGGMIRRFWRSISGNSAVAKPNLELFSLASIYLQCRTVDGEAVESSPTNDDSRLPNTIEGIICEMHRFYSLNLRGRYQKPTPQHQEALAESSDDDDGYFSDDSLTSEPGERSIVSANDADGNNRRSKEEGEEEVDSMQERKLPWYRRLSNWMRNNWARLRRNPRQEQWKWRVAESEKIAAMIRNLRQNHLGDNLAGAVLASNPALQDEEVNSATTAVQDKIINGDDEIVAAAAAAARTRAEGALTTEMPATEDLIKQKRFALLRASLDLTIYYNPPFSDNRQFRDPVIRELAPTVSDYFSAYQVARENGEEKVQKAIEDLRLPDFQQMILAANLADQEPSQVNFVDAADLKQQPELLPSALLNVIQIFQGAKSDDAALKWLAARQAHEYLELAKECQCLRFSGVQSPYGTDEFWLELQSFKPRKLRRVLKLHDKILLNYLLSTEEAKSLGEDKLKQLRTAIRI